MNKQELKAALESAGVDEDAYWLEGGRPNEAYTLERRDNGWAVYYSEKGNRNDEVVFDTEDEACCELLNWVLNDDTVMGR
ncbi:hypothetical protein [Glycomyces buryatensis]|uniref:Uncharacterized protein n=1 Tax=Glycomyces buryatensis TaxID=2570927 RepID=A0A4V4HSU3_9ACTN|nr:hypothetical protein [Glycomyces buryatensis]THV42996.1 hypothetical protein FAB82_03315 [Glycomyces buryatensis]